MKATIIPGPVVSEPHFPMLKRIKPTASNHDIVVLFDKAHTGTVVYAKANVRNNRDQNTEMSSYVGHRSHDWSPQCWEEFNGSVTISN